MKKRNTLGRRIRRLGSAHSKLLIIAAVVVGLSSIAYAAFSQQLTINGTGTANGGNWDVAITDITLSDSDGATENSQADFTGTTATFDVDLAYPEAFAEYEITVTNAGDVAAILDSFTDLTSKNAEVPTNIIYTVSGVTAGVTTLGTDTGVDDTNVITVRVEWTDGPAQDPSSKSATIEFNYVQDL